MIPDDVRRFVLGHIPSVPYLEAALLFHGSPDVTRSVAQVAAALYLNEAAAAGLVDALCNAGILQPPAEAAERYRYAPRGELAVALHALAAAYASDMIGITHLIHGAASQDARRFADAFRLRKGR